MAVTRHFSNKDQLKQEQIVLERSARLNLDPGRGDKGDGGYGGDG